MLISEQHVHQWEQSTLEKGRWFRCSFCKVIGDRYVGRTTYQILARSCQIDGCLEPALYLFQTRVGHYLRCVNHQKTERWGCAY